MDLIPHRRQYVIGLQRHAFGKDWHSFDLPNGLVLSHHTDLEVAPSADGTVLLGAAFTGTGNGSLAGRYVKLTGPNVETGPSALMSIYYAEGANGPLVSSSPALMAHLVPPGPQMKRQLHWGGLNWVPSPGSRLMGVRKLLPGQRLHILDQKADELDATPLRVGSMAEARTILADELVAVVGQVAARAGTTYLALTAGLDSRTLLAAMLAAGARLEVVTQVVNSPNDVRIASEICRYFGIRHHVIGPEPRDESCMEAVTEHGFNSICDADDSLLIPHNQYRFLSRDAVLIRGGGFEIGRRFMEPTLHGLTFENATGEIIWRRLEGDRPADAETVRLLDEWIALRRDRQDGLDLIDGFYNDQRLGGWLAALERGLDILPGASIQAANSDRIKAALLAPSLEERTAGTLQRAVIQDLEPRLMRFPVNPKWKGLEHYGRAALRRFGRATRALRHRSAG